MSASRPHPPGLRVLVTGGSGFVGASLAVGFAAQLVGRRREDLLIARSLNGTAAREPVGDLGGTDRG